MKNFIFKSKSKISDLYKIQTKLDMLLTEQRHQRSDLAHIMKLMNMITNVSVRKDTENIPEEEQLEDAGPD